MCSRCRGRKCTADVTCDISEDWSVAQWKAFLKKCYNGRRKSRPSGSDLRAAPLTLPPSTVASLEAGNPPPPPPLSKRGVDVWGRQRVPLAFSLMGSPLPTPVVWGGGGGGGGGFGSWELG